MTQGPTPRKILLIGGSMNQTTMMHEISKKLEPEFECYFTGYYADGLLGWAIDHGFAKMTIAGKKGTFLRQTNQYFADHQLRVDYKGQNQNYDLVITCSDMVFPYNIRKNKVILVQEGMTDPDNWALPVARTLKLPLWLSSTAGFGLSNRYTQFCVASQGYKEHFARRGCNPNKIIVTGIPNYDNIAKYLTNTFPHHGHVLVATTDMRETMKWDDRKRFIKTCVDLAKGRQLIFRLHPNENPERATREIQEGAPGALVFTSGDTHEMIANASCLITQHSTVTFIGLALGKEVYSYLDVEALKKMVPLQNGGKSSEAIAGVARKLVES